MILLYFNYISLLYSKRKMREVRLTIKRKHTYVGQQNHLKSLFSFPTFKCFDDFKTGKKPLHCKLWSQIIVKASI